MVVKIAARLVPMTLAAPMITIEIRDATKPYSMAVTPASSLTNRLRHACIKMISSEGLVKNTASHVAIQLTRSLKFKVHFRQIVMPTRRFPPPRTVEGLENCFVVKDGAGQKLAYVYYEDDHGRRSAAKLLTKDEARRIAVNIASLAGLIEAARCNTHFALKYRHARQEAT
jgi:hypothetical protein